MRQVINRQWQFEEVGIDPAVRGPESCDAEPRLCVRVRETPALLSVCGVSPAIHGQIDQALGRVRWGQAIPHVWKLFSILQRHAEWIVKGKAGAPVGLGRRVLVEDEYGLIPTHLVMEQTTDDRVAGALSRPECASTGSPARASTRASAALPIGMGSPPCARSWCCRRRASAPRAGAHRSPSPPSGGAGTLRQNRPSMPWRSPGGIVVRIMSSRASSGNWPRVWLRATSSVPVPCRPNRRRNARGGLIAGRREHHRPGQTVGLAGSACPAVG